MTTVQIVLICILVVCVLLLVGCFWLLWWMAHEPTPHKGSEGQAQPSTPPKRSWRSVLSLGDDATLTDARRKFLKIAKETHPDAVGADANLERFSEAERAYNDAEKELKS